jgi:hypothetical protein
LAHDSVAGAEEPVAGEGWRIRARQLLRAIASAASARATGVLLGAANAVIDSGIAFLQRLRQRSGGAQHADECRDHERPGKPATMERARGEAVSAEAEAPKPRGRLRRMLVYLGVMLAGSMGGTALAYNLFAQALDRQSAEITRQEVKLSKYSKSAVELEKKLEQAQQVEAETRLAAALAQNEKKIGELQAQRGEEETQPGNAPAAHAGNPQRQQDAGKSGAAARSGQTAWTRSGSCTLSSGNVRSVLKGCIADMERK